MSLNAVANSIAAEDRAQSGAISSSVDEGKPRTKEEKKPKVKRRQEGTFCKGQRIPIYPTSSQEELLRKWVGSGRYIWNWGLDLQNQHFDKHKKHLSTKALTQELTSLRQTPELEWLGEVPRTVLTYAHRNLDKAWGGFFDGIKGKRLDNPGKPKFRARGGSGESATFQSDGRHEKPYRFNKPENTGHGEVRIPGLGWVRAFFSEPVLGEVSSITVKQEGETWIASFSLINIEQTKLHRNTGKKIDKKIAFDFPGDDPTCLIVNPNREGVAAIDGSCPKVELRVLMAQRLSVFLRKRKKHEQPKKTNVATSMKKAKRSSTIAR